MISIYKIGTLLRYYPEAGSNEHYTAVVGRKSIIQVKPAANKYGRPRVRSVESIEEWLATLPGSPSMDRLKIEEPKNCLNNPQVYINRVSDSWNVPNMNHSTGKWAFYIYRMMYEANKDLCKRDDIRDAYNHLVEVLESSHKVIVRDVMHIDYYNGIKIENSSFLPEGSVTINKLHCCSCFCRCGCKCGCGGSTDKLPYYKMSEYLAVLDAYHPLYELIKADVIPYMERKYEIIKNTRELKFANKMMHSSARKIDSLQQKIIGLRVIYANMKARAEAATAILNKTA